MNHRYKYCKPLLDGQTAADDEDEDEAEFEAAGSEFEERRSLNDGCAA